MTDKQFSADGSSITGRISGNPENEGNRNNYAEGTLRSTGKTLRVEARAGLGVTPSADLGNGIKIVGTAGVEGKAGVNLVATPDSGAAAHNRRYDVPIRERAMGFYELRDMLNEIVAVNPDLRQHTVADIHRILNAHPNASSPESLARFNHAVESIQNTHYTPPAELLEAKATLDAVRTRWEQEGRPALAAQNAQSLLERYAPNARVSEQGKAVIDNMLQRANGNISNALDHAANIPPALLTAHSAAEYIMPRTLEQVDSGAREWNKFVEQNGGAQGISGRVTSPVNDALARAGQGQLSPAVGENIGRAVERGNDYAYDITRQYGRLLSPETVLDHQRHANKLAQLDPTAEASAYVGAGVLTPYANAAVIAEKGAHVSAGNIDRIPSEGLKIHPAISERIRLEVGKGPEGLSFSPDTAAKLNLSTRTPGVGGYAFVEQAQLSWHGTGLSQDQTSAGAGLNWQQPISPDISGFTNVEASCVKTPKTPKDCKASVKAGIKF